MSRHEPLPFLSYGAVTDPQDLRRGNRNRILRSIITRGPATRAELARRTGMSRPTVSVIANELLTSGVLVEGDRVSSGGAPGTLLEMARHTGVTFVVDMQDLQALTLGTVTATGEVVSRSTTSVADEVELLHVIEAAAGAVERRSLIGAALAVRGFVNPRGVWMRDGSGIDLVEKLRRSLRMPVHTVSATDAVTIADLRDSPEGLAAQATLVARAASIGFILEGRLLTGQKRRLGDVAHVVPGTDGPACPECGRVCLSAMLNRGSAEQMAAGIATVMAPVVAALEVEEIVLALLPARVATQVQTQTAEDLRARLPDHLVPAVRLSQQGEDAVLVGAAAMMLYSRLS